MTESKDATDPSNFKPGLYRHYKGGVYTAIQLVRHHEKKEPYVVYLSMNNGRMYLREWCTPGADSWADMVQYRDTFGNLTGEVVPRFKFLSPSHYEY
jgi:hypothetical protein